MPRVSAFYGIVIWIYHDEIHHRGRPHFHATYSGDEASVDIETLEIIAGELPPRARQLIADWARAHQGELRANWERAQRHEPIQPIARSARRSTIGSVRSTPLLLEATPRADSIVHVRFDDGTTADVDLSYLRDYGGVFEPLRDPSFFRQLRVDREAGTIVWPNDADIAPETLYAHAQGRAAIGA